MRYGFGYQGSKNAIAEWLIRILPPGKTFVDLFAGGCAITHCALLSGKWDEIICNDITGTPEIFMAACHGEFKGYATVPTREEFFENYKTDDVMALLYSFGNSRSTYLWGKDIEPLKVAASKMILAPSTYERRIAYKRFIDELAKYIKENGLENPRKVNELQPLEQLQALERLPSLERLQALEDMQPLEHIKAIENLQALSLDYRAVDIPNDAIVYADPPYINADTKGYKGFDHEAFYSWLAAVDFPVFVSEYTSPPGCIEIVSKDKRKIFNSYDNSTIAREGLFVQERFQDDQRVIEAQERANCSKIVQDQLL